MIVKCRNYLNDKTIPKKIKIKVPSWAGESGHKNPNPWHCKPFMDASQYGYELIYPFEGKMYVKKQNGKLSFESENKLALNYIDEFAPNYYSISSFIDLNPPEGYLTRIEPHPRFYTDVTGNCPLAVAGHLKRFWARIFFVVFKSPLEGQTHIFSYEEPYASLLFLPENSDFKIDLMSEGEIKFRENIEKNIHDKGAKIATHSWFDSKGNNFNNKYKVLNKMYENKGLEFVFNYLGTFNLKKIKNYFFKPTNKVKL